MGIWFTVLIIIISTKNKLITATVSTLTYAGGHAPVVENLNTNLEVFMGKLVDCKVYVQDGEESRRVQEHAFKLGYKWLNGDVIPLYITEEDNTHFLRFYSDGIISRFIISAKKRFDDDEAPELSVDEFLELKPDKEFTPFQYTINIQTPGQAVALSMLFNQNGGKIQENLSDGLDLYSVQAEAFSWGVYNEFNRFCFENNVPHTNVAESLYPEIFKN